MRIQYGILIRDYHQGQPLPHRNAGPVHCGIGFTAGLRIGFTDIARQSSRHQDFPGSCTDSLFQLVNGMHHKHGQHSFPRRAIFPPYFFCMYRNYIAIIPSLSSLVNRFCKNFLLEKNKCL